MPETVKSNKAKKYLRCLGKNWKKIEQIIVNTCKKQGIQKYNCNFRIVLTPLIDSTDWRLNGGHYYQVITSPLRLFFIQKEAIV